ncbi:MAG TPA: flavodoxin family protein [bacterium]|nr:flavodoxin family protein [bacterium]HOL35147.1 flavodoxin family protein [bacterium]HPP08433.1 flavodoxin family protein [bacterium]
MEKNNFNILLISASPRKNKSQTFALANQVLAGCSPETSEVIHLCDYKIEFCRHCEKCHKKILDCPIKDDVKWILQKMLDADGIILASPNYINQVTGAMKTLFDRSSHFIHCKKLLDKYVAGVISSGSGRDKPVIDYLRHYAFTCGAQFVGAVSSSVPISEEKKKQAFKLGVKLASAIKNRKIFPAQVKIIQQGKEYFKNRIIARKHEWQGEYDYWKEKKWL